VGRKIPALDGLIAATALAHDLVVVTRNTVVQSAGGGLGRFICRTMLLVRHAKCFFASVIPLENLFRVFLAASSADDATPHTY